MDDLEKKIDYAERLIVGVREMVRKHGIVYDNDQEYLKSEWLDADLLCMVVEEELLPALKDKALKTEGERDG